MGEANLDRVRRNQIFEIGDQVLVVPLELVQTVYKQANPRCGAEMIDRVRQESLQLVNSKFQTVPIRLECSFHFLGDTLGMMSLFRARS